MRIAGQATRIVQRRGDFLAIMREVARGEAAFEKRARVNAGRAVRLEEHQVATILIVACAKEMIEADFEQVRCAGVACDMATQVAVGDIGARDHGERVPAHQRREFFLDGKIAGKCRLQMNRNRVQVRCDEVGCPADMQSLGQPRHLVEDEAHAFWPVYFEQRAHGVAPFRRFTGVDIDVVGISNFTTFLTNTESYRRDLRRAEYGDEREPEMRAFHEKIAPLNNAKNITRPLFVAQGFNDPRVPYTEAEQMVKAVRSNGGDVWYLMYKDEGHGFQKKSNNDYFGAASMLFWQKYCHRIRLMKLKNCKVLVKR